MYATALEDTVYITENPNLCTADAVWALLRQTHWASERSLDTVRTSMNHSQCFFLMDGLQLAGFARVISDQATFAYLCDVVIDDKYRGSGYGSLLLEHILNSPALAKVPQWRLKTTYAAEFYSRFGFTPVSGDIVHMEYYPVKPLCQLKKA